MSVVGVYSAMYNSSKYVAEMISSIQAQTFKNWELSIIDDGSSDNSYQTVLDISKSDSRIKVGRIEHCGIVGKVKNTAISMFTGNPKYLCGVDSDDLIIPNTLTLFVDFLEKNPELGACCGNFKCFDDKGNKWAFPHVANSGEYDSNILLRYMCFFPLRFFKKSIFDKIKGYSEELTNADDYDLALKIDEITTIKRIKEPVTYLYRQHDQQIAHRLKNEENKNAKKALNDALKRRGINGVVKNEAPPFIIEFNDHFIWGKK